MNVIGTALEELYRMFDILNHDKFDNVLPVPVITIQKTRGNALGHFTVNKVWKKKTNDDGQSEEEAYYEINIDPRWFNERTAEDIAETLLHEMVHYYNKVSDIKDCSGNVHNKKFKERAESVGLIVTKGKSVGWGYTSMSDELEEYVKEKVAPLDTAFEYFRSDVVKDKDKPKKKSLFKITCPQCGQEAKGKRGVSIKCGNCNVPMVMEPEDDDNKS